MKDTISIVIPALNEEKNIGSTLNCLLKQKEKPLEIIVVDNGSKDKTKQVVKNLISKFKKKEINLKLFYHPYGNQTNARDFGVRKSSGTIIGTLDAESWPNKEWTSKIIEYFKDKNIVAIGGKSRFRNRSWFFNFFYFLNYRLRLMINLYCIGGGNGAFRKKTFFLVNGYNGLEKLRKEKNILYAKDDYYLSKKLEQKGRVKFCPDLRVTILHRIRNKSNEIYDGGFSVVRTLKRVFFEFVYDYTISYSLKKK